MWGLGRATSLATRLGTLSPPVVVGRETPEVLGSEFSHCIEEIIKDCEKYTVDFRLVERTKRLTRPDLWCVDGTPVHVIAHRHSKSLHSCGTRFDDDG